MGAQDDAKKGGEVEAKALNMRASQEWVDK